MRDVFIKKCVWIGLAVVMLLPLSTASASGSSQSQLVEGMLAAISAKDLPALERDIAADASMQLEFAPEAPIMLHGRSAIAGYFKAFFDLYSTIFITNIIKTPAADGKTITIESKGTFRTPTGDEHSVSYVWIITTSANKIQGSRTYILPLRVGAAK